MDNELAYARFAGKVQAWAEMWEEGGSAQRAMTEIANFVVELNEELDKDESIRNPIS